MVSTKEERITKSILLRILQVKCVKSTAVEGRATKTKTQEIATLQNRFLDKADDERKSGMPQPHRSQYNN